MSDLDIEEGDVSAMRREGDLRQFLRGLNRAGRQKLDARMRDPQPTARTGGGTPEGHRAGAWPTGVTGATTCGCSRCVSYAARHARTA